MLFLFLGVFVSLTLAAPLSYEFLDFVASANDCFKTSSSNAVQITEDTIDSTLTLTSFPIDPSRTAPSCRCCVESHEVFHNHVQKPVRCGEPAWRWEQFLFDPFLNTKLHWDKLQQRIHVLFHGYWWCEFFLFRPRSCLLFRHAKRKSVYYA